RGEIAATPAVESSAAKSVAAAPAPIDSTQAARGEGDIAAADAAIPEKTSVAASASPMALPPPETPSVKLASINPAEALPDPASKGSNAVATTAECATDACIDEYLWSAYQRAPKQDTVKETEQVKVTITKKGKTRTVTKTVAKLVDEDFAWKDPKAAEK